jgi:hypothetical protein
MSPMCTGLTPSCASIHCSFSEMDIKFSEEEDNAVWCSRDWRRVESSCRAPVEFVKFPKP